MSPLDPLPPIVSGRFGLNVSPGILKVAVTYGTTGTISADGRALSW
jgi:hypothetical protein